jgi:hypothetical protein
VRTLLALECFARAKIAAKIHMLALFKHEQLYKGQYFKNK